MRNAILNSLSFSVVNHLGSSLYGEKKLFSNLTTQLQQKRNIEEKGKTSKLQQRVSLINEALKTTELIQQTLGFIQVPQNSRKDKKLTII